MLVSGTYIFPLKRFLLSLWLVIKVIKACVFGDFLGRMRGRCFFVFIIIAFFYYFSCFRNKVLQNGGNFHEVLSTTIHPSTYPHTYINIDFPLFFKRKSSILSCLWFLLLVKSNCLSLVGSNYKKLYSFIGSPAFS